MTVDPTRGSQIRGLLERDSAIAVVGQVAPEKAARRVLDELPNVVIVDVRIADHGSQGLIEELMSTCPRPILMLAESPDYRQSQEMRDALDAGAVEAVIAATGWTPELGIELRRAVHLLSKVHVIRHPRRSADGRGSRASVSRSRSPVVAIAASTGGPSALALLLAGLDGLRAPVLVVQHLLPDFATGLLSWMSRVSALPVRVAVDGEIACVGQVYLAPGDLHLRLGISGHLELRPTPVTIHRPSADELFESVAANSGASGVGVILTGMGDDGARGLLAMRNVGAATLGQDEASSVVFGMPRAAERLGAVTSMLPLDQLAPAIQRAVAGVLV